MLGPVRKLLSLVLSWFLVFIPIAVYAQDSAAQSAAPVPPQILSAHTVFVSNGGGSNYFDMFTGGPDRAYNTLYADLQKGGHYQLVGSPAQADLIFEIRAVAPAVDEGHTASYNPQLILSIRDPKTSAVLWTTRANVIAIGRQKNRDRHFDACVAVLLDKLGQVTGQPLSPQQVKAIRDNSRMPTGVKVFLIVTVLAFVGAGVGYGIYFATHRPTLQPPPQPSLP